MTEQSALITFVVDSHTPIRVVTKIKTICVRRLGNTLHDAESVNPIVAVDRRSSVGVSASNIEICPSSVRTRRWCIGVADVVCGRRTRWGDIVDDLRNRGRSRPLRAGC